MEVIREIEDACKAQERKQEEYYKLTISEAIDT